MELILALLAATLCVITLKMFQIKGVDFAPWVRGCFDFFLSEKAATIGGLFFVHLLLISLFWPDSKTLLNR